MELVVGIIFGLLILGFLVVAHELGHAIVARRNGVVVEEFGIGFPPCAYRKKLKNGINFSLNWLPLGGFVKLQGEHDAANKKGDYGAVSFWKKTKILLAGVLTNWIIAVILLTILAVTGLPKVLSNQFVIASDTTITKQSVALSDGFGQREFIKATWSAPIVGVVTTGQFTWATLEGFGELISNLAKGVFLQFSPNQATRAEAGQNLKAAGARVSGPIGILSVIFPQAERAGLTQLVFLTAIISLSLAVMNVLPIPALDGGRWFLTAIFRITKKELTQEREEKILTAGFLTLMGLTALATIADVTKFF